jgi:hypothetical protein
VKAKLGPPLRYQEIAVFRRKIEWELPKKENLSALERLTIRASLSLGLPRPKPAGGQLIVFDRNPRRVWHNSLVSFTSRATMVRR